MTAEDDLYPFADLALSRRLERAEGRVSSRYVEATARAFPDRGTRWIEVAGAYAMYDGVASPVTQTFCLGLFQPLTAPDLDAIEAFFRDRGAPVFHEVSPLADPSAFALLAERGYRPVEFTSVMFRPIRPDVRLARPPGSGVTVRPIRDDERDVWAQTAARGWAEAGEVTEFLRDLGPISREWTAAYSFLAVLDGRPIATAAAAISDGVAHMAGASTVPEGRRRGAQLALLEARLRFAAEQGCDLALMGASPGSASQRNAERHGFRIAYTRTKWRAA
jgi:GNAT superfamily N-acetyltransferase